MREYSRKMSENQLVSLVPRNPEQRGLADEGICPAPLGRLPVSCDPSRWGATGQTQRCHLCSVADREAGPKKMFLYWRWKMGLLLQRFPKADLSTALQISTVTIMTFSSSPLEYEPFIYLLI